MRVAVVTAYYKESQRDLLRCLNSVARQSHPCTHFMISDGHPQAFLDQMDIRHLKLGQSHRDYGDTPRAVGSMLVMREDFDAIAFLDADNYFAEDHIESLVKAAQSEPGPFDVVTAQRFFLRPDGSRMPLSEPESHHNHTDTSCYLITRRAFSTLPVWGLMPRQFSVIGDRVFWRALLARGYRIAHVPKASVGYTSTWKVQYQALREEPPEGAKEISGEILETAQWWWSLATEEKNRISSVLGFDPETMFAAKRPAAPTTP